VSRDDIFVMTRFTTTAAEQRAAGFRLPGRRSGRSLIALVCALGAVGISSSLIVAAESPVVTQAALAGDLEVAVRVDPPVVVAEPPPPPVSTLSADVQAILDLTNIERAAYGIAPLEFHPDLAVAADIHGNDQRNKPCALVFLTHTGSDLSSPGDRIKRVGLRVSNWAENIACGYRTPEAVMIGWMNSPGHRSNILNPALTHIGISVLASDDGVRYWVQDFAVPRL
jgi:uncharacterized protein YkwD